MENILVLEDDAALRNSIVRYLADRGGFDVTAYGLVSDAVAALDRQPPRLIITDLDLPDGSGLDLLSELTLRGIHCPLILITAYLDRFQAQLPSSPNINVVAKPFDPLYLIELVCRRLSRHSIEAAPQSAFSVADYLQLAGMARRSVTIEISQNGESVGKISVVDGTPRFASDLQGEGEAAFRRLAMLPQCTIACLPIAAPLTRANLAGSLEHLLIDAARESDEAGRELKRSAAPVAPASGAQRSQAANAAPAPVRPPRLPPRPPVPAPSANVASTQEKSVNQKLPAVNLSQIAASDAGIEAVARADRSGSVLEAMGKFDAETACAVALMAAKEVIEGASELGFGRPTAFHVATTDATWFIAHRRDEVFVAKGAANKNPMSAQRKFAKACGV